MFDSSVDGKPYKKYNESRMSEHINNIGESWSWSIAEKEL